MAGCRIARIRHKASGKTIEVLNRPVRHGHAATIVEHAATIADASPNDLIGFFIVGVDRNGSFNVGWRISDDAPFGPTMFSAFLSEIIRRKLATETAMTEFSIDQGWLRR